MIGGYVMNNFVGVFGEVAPVAGLNALGSDVVWQDEGVAFGGAPVWTDTTGTIVVSGELVLDNADELRLETQIARCGPRRVVGRTLSAAWSGSGFARSGDVRRCDMGHTGETTSFDTRWCRCADTVLRHKWADVVVFVAVTNPAAKSRCVKRYFPDSVAEISNLRFRSRRRHALAGCIGIAPRYDVDPTRGEYANLLGACGACVGPG